MQREYLLRVIINGRKLRRVVIDSHYEKRHSDTVTDEVILDLVKEVAKTPQVAEKVTSNGFEIYVTEPVYREGKPYRLVWTTHPNEDYVGVINAFRRKHAKISE